MLSRSFVYQCFAQDSFGSHWLLSDIRSIEIVVSGPLNDYQQFSGEEIGRASDRTGGPMLSSPLLYRLSYKCFSMYKIRRKRLRTFSKLYGLRLLTHLEHPRPIVRITFRCTPMIIFLFSTPFQHYCPSVVLVNSRKDMNDVNFRHDMTEILLNAA